MTKLNSNADKNTKNGANLTVGQLDQLNRDKGLEFPCRRGNVIGKDGVKVG